MTITYLHAKFQPILLKIALVAAKKLCAYLKCPSYGLGKILAKTQFFHFKSPIGFLKGTDKVKALLSSV